MLAIFTIIIIIIALSVKKGGNKDQGKSQVNKVTDPDYKYASIDTINQPEGIKYECHTIY